MPLLRTPRETRYSKGTVQQWGKAQVIKHGTGLAWRSRRAEWRAAVREARWERRLSSSAAWLPASSLRFCSSASLCRSWHSSWATRPSSSSVCTHHTAHETMVAHLSCTLKMANGGLRKSGGTSRRLQALVQLGCHEGRETTCTHQDKSAMSPNLDATQQSSYMCYPRDLFGAVHTASKASCSAAVPKVVEAGA